MSFSSARKELTARGFRPDYRSFDRLLMRFKRCRCGRWVSYYGLSNATEYQAFGVCEKCDCVVWWWKEAASTTIGDLFDTKPDTQPGSEMRVILERLDAVIAELVPQGCPIFTHGKPDCFFCKLLAAQVEARRLMKGL